MQNRLKSSVALALAAGVIAASSGWAIADEGHGHASEIGRVGEDHHVSRTFEVRMGEMYFKPARIRVEPGEVVRFIVVNEGEAVHEFNLGTMEHWEGHEAEMERLMDNGMIDGDVVNHAQMRNMGMSHTDPNAVLLEPGERAEIIWEFPDTATEIGYACNVPGHREAGMVGEIGFEGES